MPEWIISFATSGGVFSKIIFMELQMEFKLSLMDSYTVWALISSSMGRPLTRSLPTTTMVSSLPGRPEPNVSFNVLAVFWPMTRLKVRLIWLMMDSSMRFPPKWRRSLNTRPPREITEISVVSAPMSTIMTPVGSFTSRPKPTASAMGFSQSRTFFGFVLLL